MYVNIFKKLLVVLFILVGTNSLLFAQSPSVNFELGGDYREELYGLQPDTPEIQSKDTVMADFNGDQIPDQAVNNFIVNQSNITARVQIFLGQANGSQVLSDSIFLEESENYIFNVLDLGDFNGDGNIDLVSSNLTRILDFDQDDLYLQVYFGNGDGTFAKPGFIKEVFDWPVVMDMNKDQRDDIVTLEDFNIATVLLGQTDKSFQAVSTPTSTQRPFNLRDRRTLVVRDFNQDNMLDLWLGEDLLPSEFPDLDYNPVFLGKGDGSFETGTLYSFQSSNTKQIVVANFNNDGLDDLGVVSDSQLEILLNQGNGNYQSISTFTFSDPINKVFTAQLDNDNFIDLLVSLENGGIFSTQILLGQGNGQFSLSNNGSSLVGEIRVVENLDQNAGAEVLTQDGNQTKVYANNGQASFSLSQSISTSADYVGVGNFDGDGTLDILVSQTELVIFPDEREIDVTDFIVLTGLGNLQYSTSLDNPFASISSEPFEDTVSPQFLVADLNQDGKSDIVYTFLLLGGGSGVDTRPQLFIMLNQGDNTSSIVPYTPSVAGGLVFASDANGDGILDIINSGKQEYFSFRFGLLELEPGVEVMLGQGDGSFTSSVRFSLPYEDNLNFRDFPTRVYSGNFNGDNLPDLAFTPFGTGKSLGIALNTTTSSGTKPSVQITSPNDNLELVLGNMVQVEAQVQGIGNNKVEFLIGFPKSEISIDEAQNGDGTYNFQYTATNIRTTPRTLGLIVRIVDNLDQTIAEDVVDIVVISENNEPNEPSVEITSPVGGQEFVQGDGNLITFEANVTGSEGKRVRLLWAGPNREIQSFEGGQSAYTFEFPTTFIGSPPRMPSFKVQILDGSQVIAEDEVQVTVLPEGSTPDPTPSDPSVTITSPSEDLEVLLNSTVQIQANVAGLGSNKIEFRVAFPNAEFLIDEAQNGDGTYDFVYVATNIQNTPRTLGMIVRMVDAQGQTVTEDIVNLVVVSETTQPNEPSVEIISPNTNQEFVKGDVISFQANVSGSEGKRVRLLWVGPNREMQSFAGGQSAYTFEFRTDFIGSPPRMPSFKVQILEGSQVVAEDEVQVTVLPEGSTPNPDPDPNPTPNDPSVEITSPIGGQEFVRGEGNLITFEANVSGSEGKRVRLLWAGPNREIQSFAGGQSAYTFEFPTIFIGSPPRMPSFKVQILDGSQVIAEDEVKVTVLPEGSNAVASNRLNTSSVLSFYPNKVKEGTQIRLKLFKPTQEAAFVIRDAMGQLVQSGNFNLDQPEDELAIDLLKNIPAGLYILEIRDQAGFSQIRFIKE